MFKDILFPVDLPNQETQEKALSVAVDAAKTYGARLHVMTVVPSMGSAYVANLFPEGFEKKAIAKAKEQLDEYVKTKVPQKIKVQRIVAHGTIYKEVLAAAHELKIDLIVMASHRPELQDYLLGPNAARVVRHADCSVLVVRNEGG